MEIQDKIALVTGSTRGIGRAIGEKLCRLGAIVYFNSHSSEAKGIKLKEELQKQGLKAFYINADVSSEREVRKIFETIKKQQGRLDILVNNAGVYLQDTASYDDYLTIHKVNGYSYYLCCYLASQMMNRGKIVNISSIYGVAPDQDSILASGVKAEVEAYTLAFAKKLKGKVWVNSIAPGYIETTLLKTNLSKEYIDNAIRNTPIRRLIKPEEIANTVVYLVNNDGITGQTIIVDGGYIL